MNAPLARPPSEARQSAIYYISRSWSVKTFLDGVLPMRDDRDTPWSRRA
jgi:hypothetical protein